ncbi:transposase [Streptomyces abikoensis]|uniref:Transposase n=1 Tax=Streptomyces ehimensis TaxID=68195 RepID=A0ABV9BVT0_9ACTN
MLDGQEVTKTASSRSNAFTSSFSSGSRKPSPHPCPVCRTGPHRIRPRLEIVYSDALWARIHSRTVASRPVRLAVGVDMADCKDVLGLWANDGSEDATAWMFVLSELRNCGHFPSEHATLKVLYLAVRELTTTKARDVNNVAPHWRKPPNQFSLA